MDNITTIQIKKETRLKMMEKAKKCETFDDYINRLMDDDGKIQ